MHSQDGDAFRLWIDGPPRRFAAEFEGDYRVDRGAITFPIASRIRVAGVGRKEMAEAMEMPVADGKIFTNFKSRGTISVGGGVRSRGRQKWVPGMTLTQALAASADSD